MMKEVTMHYVIFGAGRVGVNMSAYLTSLGHDVDLVSHDQARRSADDCKSMIAQADIIAAALPDSKIEAWFAQWQDLIEDKTVIHFSGALTIGGLYGYHPLFSFPNYPLSPNQLSKIVFACSQDGPEFNKVFPQALNPHFTIPDNERARYHALAVLSGNFISYLMNKTGQEFAHYFGKEGGNGPCNEAFAVYMESVMARYEENPENSMTGPIARRDHASVMANREALISDDSLRHLYDAFLSAAWPEYNAEDKTGSGGK